MWRKTAPTTGQHASSDEVRFHEGLWLDKQTVMCKLQGEIWICNVEHQNKSMHKRLPFVIIS